MPCKPQTLHWDEFLAGDANFWKVTRYVKPDEGFGCSGIPPLQRSTDR